MLRTLLTPLRSRFDVSPRVPPQNAPGIQEDEQDPEDFARDVLVELMRNSVEELKQAESYGDKARILGEIQRIMNQNAYTKDVFREMDGFLSLYNVLSTLRTSVELNQVESDANTLEGIQLVLEILSDATFEHNENARFCMKEVGYEPLRHALEGLSSEVKTIIAVLGLLLCFILHNFTLKSVFRDMQDADLDAVDHVIAQYGAHFQSIHHPGALPLLWTLHQRLSMYPSIRYGFSKVLAHLSSANHRNFAVMSNTGLVLPILEYFHSSKGDEKVTEKERHAWQKLLRRLLELGAEPSHARLILQKAVREGNVLDLEMLDLIRYGSKSRWVDHFSMGSSSAFVAIDEDNKGLPASGITFLTWIFMTHLPVQGPWTLFSVSHDSKPFLTLRIRSDGRFEFSASSSSSSVTFSKATIRKGRWTHLALVHYPSRSSSPSVRLFLDGVIQDGINWAYPKPESRAQGVEYTIGNGTGGWLSWCLSSAYLLATPIADDLVRFVHHLGPRYVGNFQDSALVKFLTYEASTSLNIFLATAGSKNSSQVDGSPILKVVRRGMNLNESEIVFSISATSVLQAGIASEVPASGAMTRVVAEGDVYVVKAACFDNAIWAIGGAAVLLRLVQLAQSPHELSRALSILTECLKNSWQNSEDMERLRGYEILADMLRRKSQHINLTSFEILFEFLGINPRTPESSTVVNLAAYRAIALDFELWSRTKKELQIVYFEHFVTLVETSRYRIFNIMQRLSKLGLVRKMFFVLQTDWYSADMTNQLIETLGALCRADFSRDGVVKPLVSFLAANLHEDPIPAGSPRSTFSRIDLSNFRGKCERVLQLLVSILSVKQFYVKFVAALPLTRICLLLLGNHPSPAVSTQILKLLDISIGFSSSFIRKFELVSGWNVLKTVLPYSWNAEVNDAAFNLLMGRIESSQPQKDGPTINCPQIVPTILSALQAGLVAVASSAQLPDDADTRSIQLSAPPLETPVELGSQPPMASVDQIATMEALIEEFLNFHSAMAQFRSIFQSQIATQLFVDGYKTFVKKLAELPEINPRTVRILEKLTHFGLALALDNSVAGSQKREILDVVPIAEGILNPNAERTSIDPSLVADTRSMRQRIASARLSLQVGERTIIKIVAKIGEWRKAIQASERKRFRKLVLDLRESRRQVSRLQDWAQSLTAERGLWPTPETRLWRLDETEGPYRTRRKLEPEIDKIASSRQVIDGSDTRGVQAPQVETHQNTTEIPPWAESYEISSTEVDEPALVEDVVEDKLRRVRHELEPGDVIDAVATIARIVGVDSSPGLLIFGKTHLYILDGIVENDDGEIIDAHDAPKRLLFVPGSIVELDGPPRARRWAHNQVAGCSEKTFLFRDVALEIYFKDSRSLLVVFLDRKRRSETNYRLSNIINKNAPNHLSTPGLLRTPGPFSSRLPTFSRSVLGFKPDDLGTATRKWQAREISNFSYISILNQASGRTPSDATQYPVFPWVLQDYTSETLDLMSPSSYRDLTRPMGALTQVRREAAKTRYENLESVGEKPFHYGTHFSSSMIVCHFLIRLAPFTNMFKTLQGGDWDLPDRLFSDLARAYESAAHDIRGDVRELIPEFFTCPEFLENLANHDFGIQQSTGERIHDVKLPPWAKGDPLLFVTLHRRALESDYVSENLPAWIDLIWGHKQRDPASLNVFHPLSYEGAINLDEITDELEREATVGIIHNFGQTPRKLFTTPHPPRYNHGLPTLPLGTLHGVEEDFQLLNQGSRCFRDLGPTTPIRQLLLDPVGDTVIPCPQGSLIAPMYPHEQINWNVERREIRVLVDHQVAQVIENASCCCATFVDSDCIVTGWSDYTVRQWKLHRSGSSTPTSALGPFTSVSTGKPSISLSYIMRIHIDEVVCVAASRTWCVIVSGSKDGSAAIWELNRGGYVRSIWHPQNGNQGPAKINLVAINESTGYIATCSTTTLLLHTINGWPIASLDLTTLPSYYSPHVPSITSLAFHERDYSYMGVLATGASDGTISLWTWAHNSGKTDRGDGEDACQFSQGKPRWTFTELRRLKARNTANGRPPCITALRFTGEKLYHGEETGKCFIWTLPDSD